MFFIYKLYHPLSKRIYIGQTYNIKERLSGHLGDKSTTKKTSWIKSLKMKYNDIPHVQIVQSNISDEVWANSYEKSWIEYYRNNYGVDNVLNMTDGGEGFKKGCPPNKTSFKKGCPPSETSFKKGHIESEETWKKRCNAIKNNLPSTAFKKGLIPKNRKIKDVDIENIKELYLDGLSFSGIAKEFGVDRTAIPDLIKGKTYKTPSYKII